MDKTDSFQVIAGWIPEEESIIGTCDINRARGREVISFMYDETWIRKHPGLVLDPSLIPTTGRQYSPHDGVPFGFLSDIAPDRWGRRLMERKEVEDARNEERSKRTLMESDYILMVSDEGRQGGIRIKTDGVWQSPSSPGGIPPMTDIRTLEAASQALEDHQSDVKKWLRQLMVPGSSLGGARPKANVMDPNGSLWIAKFPSLNDETDVGAWEKTAHDLAGLCGLRVSESKIMKLSPRGTTFVTKRFDRYVSSQGNPLTRRHFASAMTMLEKTDSDPEPAGYLDIANVIEKICGHSATENLKELWRRIVFNILISNTDDHLRNHGFLLCKDDSWELSPAYDLNPSLEKDSLSLNIDFDNNDKDPELALSVCEMFRMSRTEAEKEVREMKSLIADNWRFIASENGISKKEQDYMERCFLL